MITEKFHQTLRENGWCFIGGDYYEARQEDLDSLREHFASPEMILDPYSSGNRYRAYAQCRYSETKGYEFGQFHTYMSTKEYNPDTGGIVREYPPINQEVLTNPLFLKLIAEDIELIKQYGLLGHPSELSIGAHLFRYKATYDSPAYSSPIYLHRDDEDVVFVHLINKSNHFVGGDNIIASNVRSVETIFALTEPLDTFVVNQEKCHAVTPIGHPYKEGFSFRDVILVSFQLMETATQHEKVNAA